MFKKSPLSESEKEIVTKMSETMAYRGPDEGKMLFFENLVLAFRRLSIIDLEKGSQPFEYGERFVGIFNGEIYNYRELRAQLIEKGYEFKTNSEIEVMLTLYSVEGESFINKLRGMFAFSFYDKEKNTVMLGRDPFGIKPLYYIEREGQVYFSSESKVFYLDPALDKTLIDEEQLQHYFTYQYIPEPSTLHPEIRILPAGSYMMLDFSAEREVRVEKYYTPTFTPVKSDDFEKRAEELREIVETSVKYHMISDVDVGTFLSGGIDSAVITATASKLNPGIKAFTVAFGEKEYSEIDEASGIARHLDVEHIKLVAGLEDFKRAFDKVVYHLDFPVADPSTMAIYLICEEAARHLKVVLSGEGSDELFGGYKVYGETLTSDKINALPSLIKAPLSFASKILPEGVKGKALLYRGTTPLEKRYVGNAFIFDEKEKKKILKTASDRVHFSDLTKDIYADVQGLPGITKMQYVDMNTWLRGDILVKGDRLSMAHSLEVRVPFLDKEVFEFARKLHTEDKLSHGTTKYIFRHAFRDLVNPETVMRPKLGYPVPVRKWLKNELYDWAKDIITNSSADAYIDKKEALRMLDAHREGREDNYRKLWVVLVFMRWYDLFVGR
ncbi:MAG: asparagine synthase (glutamine-hydrolyzing) [Clostridia bacterium]|nr:asparagine synthase (glutamine-hydrolyzing) [Clostridia bacterium]MBQ7897789.1 asparagine synthase (glutamine-hydrolyzing) [Clostridia bacterium]